MFLCFTAWRSWGDWSFVYFSFYCNIFRYCWGSLLLLFCLSFLSSSFKMLDWQPLSIALANWTEACLGLNNNPLSRKHSWLVTSIHAALGTSVKYVSLADLTFLSIGLWAQTLPELFYRKHQKMTNMCLPLTWPIIMLLWFEIRIKYVFVFFWTPMIDINQGTFSVISFKLLSVVLWEGL